MDLEEQKQHIVEGSKDPLCGRQFIGGKYRILELLGEGGVGSVYKVEHQLLRKTLALKVLKTSVIADERTILRFDQEAKAAGVLKHENLLAVHDYGVSDDGIPYIVMDYLDGISLDDEIRRLGRIDEERAIGLFMQICEGLQHAHSQGIVHRDLKPSNIIIVKDEHGNEVPKIVDFGLAKGQIVDAKLTQTGEVFGTPLYMSPEQCTGMNTDARSDIYSLGCVLYETLTGVAPFASQNAIQTILRHVNDTPLGLHEACPDLKYSAAIEAVVASCLEKDPQNRTQSAEDLKQKLQCVKEGVVPKVRRVRKLRFSPRLIWTAGGAVAFATIIMFWCVLGTLIQDVPWRSEYLRLQDDSCKAVQSGNYEQAFLLSQKALALSKNENFSAQERWDLAQVVYNGYAYTNRSAQSGPAAEEASQAAEALHKPTEAALYAIRAGRAYLHTNAKKALPFFVKAVHLAEEGGYDPRLATEMTYAARDLSSNGFNDESIPCLEVGRLLWNKKEDQGGDKLDLFIADIQLAEWYKGRNQVDKLHTVTAEADALLRQLDQSNPTVKLWEKRLHRATGATP